MASGFESLSDKRHDQISRLLECVYDRIAGTSGEAQEQIAMELILSILQLMTDRQLQKLERKLFRTKKMDPKVRLELLLCVQDRRDFYYAQRLKERAGWDVN